MEKTTKNRYNTPYHWSQPSFFEARYRAPFGFIKGLVGPQTRVLDIGCGDGYFTSFYYDLTPHVIGLEPQLRPLQFARLITEETSIRYVSGWSHQAPFKADSFDLVSLMDVIEHVPPDLVASVLGEIKRILRPGGHLVLTTPNRRNLRRRVLRTPLDPKHYQEFTRKELAFLMENDGWRMEVHEGIYLPLPIPRAEHFASTIPFRCFFNRLIHWGRRFPNLAETQLMICRRGEA